MAKGYRVVDREQSFLLPPSMVEWLPADHMVWFVIAAVERLDTSGFHVGSRRGGVGRAGYDPDMLLTLFVYAMAHGVRSSRQIERLCRSDVAFRVICAQDVPDHTVLARFRQRHQQGLADLLGSSLELAAELGMVQFGVVALDGTKIAANAALSATRRESRLRELAGEYVDTVAAQDRCEDEQFGPQRRGDEPPAGMGDRSGREERIGRALARIEQQKQAERQAGQERRERAAQYDRDVAAGKVMPGGAPRGIDPVARARAGWQRRRARAEARYQDWLGRTARARADGRRGVTGRSCVPPDDNSEVKAAWARWQAAIAAQQSVEQASPAPTSGSGSVDDSGFTANMTDPDSRKLRARHGGWLQGFNCQTAVSMDGFFVTAHACDDTNDLGQFVPTMTAVGRVADRLDRRVGVLLADSGYDSVANLAEDGPDRLIALARPAAAVTDPSAEPSPRQRMAQRLATDDGKAMYARRAAIVEAPNSWLKERRGLRRFSRRGRAAAESELSFSCAVTNLLRIAAHGITTAQLATT